MLNPGDEVVLDPPIPADAPFPRGSWVSRPGRKAHCVAQVSVSRANKPIGYWMECSRHLPVDGLELADEDLGIHDACKVCSKASPVVVAQG